MARYLNPKGVHVAYITIDAAIDVPWTRNVARKPDSAIDQTILLKSFKTVNQNKSAWTLITG